MMKVYKVKLSIEDDWGRYDAETHVIAENEENASKVAWHHWRCKDRSMRVIVKSCEEISMDEGKVIA